MLIGSEKMQRFCIAVEGSPYDTMLMQLMTPSLPDQTLRDVLQRAQEISSETGLMLKQNPEWSDLLQAAEEAGIPREAILEALRERIAPDTQEYEVNELVLATDGNGWYHTARIDSVRSATARVRFLGGGDADLPLQDIRRFTLVPGAKVNIFYGGVWTTANVVSYNRDAMSVTMNIWGGQHTATLDVIRIRDERKVMPLADRIKIWLYCGAGVLAGGSLGALITAMLMR